MNVEYFFYTFILLEMLLVVDLVFILSVSSFKTVSRLYGDTLIIYLEVYYALQ